ncbi:uncharacterized protein LOC127243590, partial [Andrographis paniculata]|uniref:uncharacterized protein LOC127243590 n=1 Tax=Andrographis paniculata TaxID=175694 RepID=UPI0021E980A7
TLPIRLSSTVQTDLQSEAQYKFGLLWIILLASCAALIIQSLAANLGAVTGKHLAEHCREEYPKVPNFILCVVAELAIVACDIPEVIGKLCEDYSFHNSTEVALAQPFPSLRIGAFEENSAIHQRYQSNVSYRVEAQLLERVMFDWYCRWIARNVPVFFHVDSI